MNWDKQKDLQYTPGNNQSHSAGHSSLQMGETFAVWHATKVFTGILKQFVTSDKQPYIHRSINMTIV